MKVIIEKLPEINSTNTDDVIGNRKFFYDMVKLLNDSKAKNIKDLSDELDGELFQSKRYHKEIIFSHGFGEEGLVISTRDYEIIGYVEGDASFIWKQD